MFPLLRKTLFCFVLTVISFSTFIVATAQTNERFTFHAQATYIVQHKNAFSAPYTGEHSLLTEAENKTSITSTLFIGAKLWQGGTIYVNPEIAGGGGLSEVFGLAAATNGETFRIGNPTPKLYVARLFIKQTWALSKGEHLQEDGVNQLAEKMPDKYFSFTVGKVSIADYFDVNTYSHDPRSQFMNWALMSNGAWDYAANTRGYTPSVIAELITPSNEFRYAFSLESLIANGNNMNWNIRQAGAHSLEYTRKFLTANRPTTLRFVAFFNRAFMGSYNQAVRLTAINEPAMIENTRNFSNHKFGFGINGEKQLTNDIGLFCRAAWNDGKNETWTFTEIDRSISGGVSITGNPWKRPNDNLGIAAAVSDLSKPHQNYLAAGGKGFMLGDGQLDYRPEQISEAYYSAALKNGISLSAGYQLIFNPGYNTDRKGPVSVFSFRTHLSI
jgi:high affinity Mn2+ porin